jgi:hypothetical protein
VTDRAEKLYAMALLIDKVSPGRSRLARAPNDKEIRATAILSIALDEVSAKIRVGPPVDDAEDMAVPIWAGLVPIALRVGPLDPDGAYAPAVDLPAMPPALHPGAQRRVEK